MEFLVRNLRIDVMMLFLVIYLIAKTFSRRNESPKHRCYHRLLWVGLMQVILVSTILYGDTLENMPVKLDFIIILAYFFGLCLCTYGWFMYSEITCESKLANNKYLRAVLVVPLVFYFFLCVTSWWTHLLMYIDEDGLYQRGSWSFLQFLIPGIYTIVLVYRALARWKKVKKFDAYQRGVLFFPMIHAVAIVLQILYGGDYIVIATVTSLAVAYIELYSVEEYELAEANQQSVSLKRQYNIIEALSREFEDVFLLDFKKQISTTFKLRGSIVPEEQRQTQDYSQACEHFISHYVYDDDKEQVKEKLRLENVLQRLKENPSFMVPFRMSYDGNLHYFQFLFAKVMDMTDDEDRVIFGYQCIDEYAKMRIDLYTDALTGLRNRRSFYHEIQQILDRRQQRIFYSLNLHDFRRINLVYGPKKGDTLLIAIADALRDAFPDQVICRLTGDEFGFVISPKDFSQSEMSQVAHTLFTALHGIKVEGLGSERYNFSIGVVFIDPDRFDNPDEVLNEGTRTQKKAREHTSNFIWSEQGVFPDVEGCFMELSKDRVLYNNLNNRLFSIHNESDWFKYLHDGALLKENLFHRNVANIDDIISYYQNKGLPDFEYEHLFRLVVNYAKHLDVFMFEMLVNNILIPYYESLQPTDRERSYLGHLYMLMVDCLISVLRMGDRTQLKRVREFIQKALDITRGFPHDSIRFEPYFYTLCEVVGHYESLQGLLCDMKFIDDAYEELRQLLTGDDRFVVPDQDVFDYFSDLVDNARLFPIYRACYLLINKPSQKPDELEEYQQRLDYIREHLNAEGVYDLAADNPEQKALASFLQSLLLNDLSVNELLERMMRELHNLRTMNDVHLPDSNIVVIAYLFLGASQTLAHSDRSDEEKRQIGIDGMEFLIEILRKRQSYATDSQVLFLIQVLMKTMFNSPVLSPALKYHYIRQTISATMLDTYCHSKAVSSYVKLILSHIIDEKPELLVGSDRPYQSVDEVKANRENLLDFMDCACMLHDIGKMNITPITSNAYRRLTDQEFSFIRRHPAYGISYLNEDEAFDVFHPFVYEHHRWWNGEGGYPKVEEGATPSRLKILVDLLSICDSLEAATSRIGRNYRSAKNFLQILDEFIVDSGIRYCPDIVNFILGNQKTFYQLRLKVDKNWQQEYLTIFQEVVSRSGSDYRAITQHMLPDLYAHSEAGQVVAPVENLRSFEVPEWYKSMEQEEQTMFTATLFEYSRLMSQHDRAVIFFYNVETDRVGFLHPTPDGKSETIFINHFSEQRINLVLSEEGYRKAIGIIHRVINEPDFPKQGETKLEYSDKRRYLIATYTSIISQRGEVLSIAGSLQDFSLSTDRLLQTINNQNHFIEIFDSIRNVYVTAIYFDITFNHFEIIKGFPALDEAAKDMQTAVELKRFVCDNIVDEEYREAFLEFLDHTTLRERLRGKPYLTLEYHSKLSGWLLARQIPVKFDADGNITHTLLVCESIEVEHKQKALLQYAASYDAMTGLMNRSNGESVISQEIAKGGAQIFAILDCDHFKQINDQLSHLVGDKVLSGQGKIIKEFFTNSFSMRLGGDEFVAYINGEEASCLINSFNGLQKHFEKLKKQLSDLRLAELENIPPTMCMGIVYTQDASEKHDFESLYRMADEALKQSKKTRFGTITIRSSTERYL